MQCILWLLSPEKAKHLAGSIRCLRNVRSVSGRFAFTSTTPAAGICLRMRAGCSREASFPYTMLLTPNVWAQASQQ
jgi:hypothetical protein